MTSNNKMIRPDDPRILNPTFSFVGDNFLPASDSGSDDWRNETPDASLQDAPYKTVPLNPHDASEHELGFCLLRFVIEVRNTKGKPYPPTSLFNLLCGIQRHCNKRPDGHCANIKIFEQSNPNFYKSTNPCLLVIILSVAFYRKCLRPQKLTQQGGI